MLQLIKTTSKAPAGAITPKLIKPAHFHRNSNVYLLETKSLAHRGFMRPNNTRRLSSERVAIVKAAANPPAKSNSKGRSIVIAVDNSPASKAACSWVLNSIMRPNEHDTTVHLVHCIPNFPSQGLYTLPDGRLAVVNFEKLMHSSESEYLKANQRVVSEWAWEIFHPANVNFVVDIIKENEVLGGAKSGIAKELCKKAEELNAAALVLTPHGRGGLGEMLVGSVADCVRISSAVPLIVLHEKKGASKGVVGWLSDVIKGVTHPDTAGTTAESIAEAAAMGPLHPGKEKKKAEGLVSTADFSSDDENLLGQTVGEVPGTEADLPGVNPESTSNLQTRRGSHGGRQIVVTVDDSDASERAAAWAAQHMYRKGDTIRLIHIVPSLPLPFTSGPIDPMAGSFVYILEPSPTAAFKEATEQYMEKRFHRMLKGLGVEFESEILLEIADGGVSSIGNAVLERSRELDAAAVVVGSHSRGGVGELLLGSLASYLEHNSDIPIVVLH